MTKLIVVLIVVVALFGGWQLFVYWEKVQREEENKKQVEVAPVVGEQLAGLPKNLESTLQAAQKQGAPGLKGWLKTYDKMVQDPRRAWIQLDYCVLVAREDPAEAKRMFASVKDRLPPASPVWPRMKQLEKTFE